MTNIPQLWTAVTSVRRASPSRERAASYTGRRSRSASRDQRRPHPVSVRYSAISRIRLSPPSVMKIARAWNEATTTANSTDVTRVRQPTRNSAQTTSARA